MSNGRSLQGGTGGAGSSPIPVKVTFPLQAGALTTADNAVVNNATSKALYAKSLASALNISSTAISITAVYICPDSSQPKCSSRRRLQAGSTYLVIEFEVTPSASITNSVIQTKTASTSFQTAVKTSVGADTSTAVGGAAVTFNTPTAVVTSPSPAPSPDNDDEKKGNAGVVVAVVIVVLAVVGVGGFFAYKKMNEDKKPEELEKHQDDF